MRARDQDTLERGRERHSVYMRASMRRCMESGRARESEREREKKGIVRVCVGVWAVSYVARQKDSTQRDRVEELRRRRRCERMTKCVDFGAC